MGIFHTINRLALDMLFPRRCVGCGDEGAWICLACGSSLVPGTLQREVGGFEVSSLFDFDVPLVREILHNLKYDGVRELAGELGKIARGFPLPDAVLIPVPLSKGRLKTRGYNQAEELARALGLPVWAGALKREGRVTTQVGKSAGERAAARKGFVWAGLPVPAEFAGRPWLVFDDLITTGSTLVECLEAVRPFAAGGLGGLTVATKN